MNKVQILGVVLIIAGVLFSFYSKTGNRQLLSGIMIGLGAGLTVYRKKPNGGA